MLGSPYFWLRNGTPAISLAPMEGVTDYPMRALLSECGGLSLCVSEFLRVSQEVPPAKVFYRHIPELKAGCRTASGVPVQVQLLGGDAEKMAAAAALACELGAQGIDLNFGCPAPTVNRHDGGATLLKYPDRIRSIVAAVRAAVPRDRPVSAKLRLGWDNIDAIYLNAERAAEGGADWITIHGRTRVQGYAPPAYWKPIGEVKRRLKIPVVANGEIWTFEDFLRCQEETQCEHFMLGRGALSDPRLVERIGAELGVSPASCDSLSPKASEQPKEWLPILARFEALSVPFFDRPGYVVRRIKQWLRFVHLRSQISWFEPIKRCETLDEIRNVLASHS